MLWTGLYTEFTLGHGMHRHRWVSLCHILCHGCHLLALIYIYFARPNLWPSFLIRMSISCQLVSSEKRELWFRGVVAERHFHWGLVAHCPPSLLLGVQAFMIYVGCESAKGFLGPRVRVSFQCRDGPSYWTSQRELLKLVWFLNCSNFTPKISLSP